eukprot:973542_1
MAQQKKKSKRRKPKSDKAFNCKTYRRRVYLCVACVSTKTVVNISPDCDHDAQYCAACIQATIQARIQKGQCKFQCQCPGCEVMWKPEQYYALLDKTHLNLVDKLHLNATLEQMEEFRWCKNPKGCGSGQLVANWRQLKGYYVCHEQQCQQQMCFKHDMPWHLGYDCKEFDIEIEKNPELATDKAVLEFTKQCPNCGTAISKLEGCDVMKCCRYGTHGCHDVLYKNQKDPCTHGGKQYCGQLFCWKCLGMIDVANGNGRYIRHCKDACQYADLND